MSEIKLNNEVNENSVLDYTDIIVQKIINRNITRAYWIMQGQGGYYKESTKELENLNFPVTVREFREEAKLESSLIYCEAVNTYDPDHFIKLGKGETTIKFTSWLYWKLRDLDGRMWRLLSTGCKGIDQYIEIGKSNRFEAEFIFRDSLSVNGREILALLETGKGFNIKKSDEYKKYSCHIGIRNFWEQFIQPDETYNYTFREFLSSWDEIKKQWHEIETDSTIYTIMDNEAM
jgi:hypothetical protein